MPLRTGQLNNLQVRDVNVVRKVETKIMQGPKLYRRALGDVANHPSLPVTRTSLKPLETKKSLPDLAKQKPTLTKQWSGKENSKVVEEEEMEVEVKEEAKVEDLVKAFSTHQLNVEDIDSKDGHNPQLVSQYVNDIYKYLWQLEVNNQVIPRYLEGQNLTGKMRTILIDWLVQVQCRFTLLPETLYLSVAIIDRYLQKVRTIQRQQLQLVGVTSMFIASKYEEMYCPDISDFSYITNKAYTTNEIRKMEIQILKKLDFNVSMPIALHFLRRNSKAGTVDRAQHTMAKYLMELTLPEYSFCHYRGSLIAAAALYLSLKLIDNLPWTDTLVFYSSYTEEQLMPVVCKLAAVIIKSTASKQQAVRQKYQASKLMMISDHPQLKSKLVKQLAERASLN